MLPDLHRCFFSILKGFFGGKCTDRLNFLRIKQEMHWCVPHCASVFHWKNFCFCLVFSCLCAKYRRLRTRRALMMFKTVRWEPKRCYCHRLSTVIEPFWCSMEHRCIVIMPFWLSTDDIEKHVFLHRSMVFVLFFRTIHNLVSIQEDLTGIVF